MADEAIETLQLVSSLRKRRGEDKGPTSKRTDPVVDGRPLHVEISRVQLGSPNFDLPERERHAELVFLERYKSRLVADRTIVKEIEAFKAATRAADTQGVPALQRQQQAGAESDVDIMRKIQAAENVASLASLIDYYLDQGKVKLASSSDPVGGSCEDRELLNLVHLSACAVKLAKIVTTRQVTRTVTTSDAISDSGDPRAKQGQLESRGSDSGRDKDEKTAAAALRQLQSRQPNQRRQDAMARQSQLETRDSVSDRDVDDETAAAAMRRLMGSLRGRGHMMDVRGICNLLWAMSKLGAGDPQTLAELVDMAALRAPEMSGQNLSNALYALASLRVLGSKQLRAKSASGSKSESGVRGLDPGSGAKIRDQASDAWDGSETMQRTSPPRRATRFDTPRVNSKASVPGEAEESAGQLPPPAWVQGLAGGWYTQQVQCLMDEVVPKLYLLGPQALSNISWALVRLDVHPSPSWLQAFEAASATQLHTARPQHLATMMWVLHKFQWQPGTAWWEAFLESSYRALPTFSYRELANTMWAMANLGLRPHQLWLQSLCHYATVRCNDADSLAVCGLVYSLARMRHRVEQPFIDSVLDSSASPKRLRNFSSIQIRDLLISLAALSISPPPAWKDACCKILLERKKEFKLSPSIRSGVEKAWKALGWEQLVLI
eukprot:gene15022-21093_t